MAGLITCAVNYPSDIDWLPKHPEIAAQQVFWGIGRPRLVTIGLGPAVQPVPVCCQTSRSKVGGGRYLKFLMSQDVDRWRYARLPWAGAGGKGSPSNCTQ